MAQTEIYKLQAKSKKLCSVLCTIGQCGEMIELVADRSQPSRMVLTRYGYTISYPAIEHPSGLCYFHRSEMEAKKAHERPKNRNYDTQEFFRDVG